MSAGVTTSNTQSGNGFGGCCPSGTHSVSRSRVLPEIRTFPVRLSVVNIAATLPLPGSRLPIPSSRISKESPTKSDGSRPAGWAASMVIVAVEAVSAAAGVRPATTGRVMAAASRRSRKPFAGMASPQGRALTAEAHGGVVWTTVVRQ
jgi:hypothetical protein